MAIDSISLRVKTPKGPLRLDSLDNTDTIAHLLGLIASQLETQPTLIQVKFGFPPKPLPEDSSEKILGDFFKSGDALLVEICKSETNGTSTQPLSGDCTMSREVIPADNSCFFAAFSFGFSHGCKDLFTPTDLRQLISASVAGNTEKYPPEVLGMQVADYQKFISNPASWGGGIEAAILAHHFQLQVRVVDIQTGRVDKFGSEFDFQTCIYLLYDGIHFDALFETKSNRTVFPTDDSSVESSCTRLAASLHQSHSFTDLSTFSLRCMICNDLLKGQTDAQNHAKSTRHINFREIS